MRRLKTLLILIVTMAVIVQSTIAHANPAALAQFAKHLMGNQAFRVAVATYTGYQLADLFNNQPKTGGYDKSEHGQSPTCPAFSHQAYSICRANGGNGAYITSGRKTPSGLHIFYCIKSDGLPDWNSYSAGCEPPANPPNDALNPDKVNEMAQDALNKYAQGDDRLKPLIATALKEQNRAMTNQDIDNILDDLRRNGAGNNPNNGGNSNDPNNGGGTNDSSNGGGANTGGTNANDTGDNGGDNGGGQNQDNKDGDKDSNTPPTYGGGGKAEKPFELPKFCDWATKVCDFVDWVKEPQEEKTELDIQDSTLPQIDTNINFGGSCPNDFQVSFVLYGKSVSFTLFEWSKICPILSSHIKPIVIALALFFSAKILGT